MTFVVNIIFRIISGPWHYEVLSTGFLALLATNTIIEVDDPGICAGFFINFQDVNGTGPQTRRIETLKTSPWLIFFLRSAMFFPLLAAFTNSFKDNRNDLNLRP
jgi:hypothetical protein